MQGPRLVATAWTILLIGLAVSLFGQYCNGRAFTEQLHALAGELQDPNQSVQNGEA